MKHEEFHLAKNYRFVRVMEKFIHAFVDSVCSKGTYSWNCCTTTKQRWKVFTQIPRFWT